MSARVLPFPLRRRHDFVQRHAAIIAGITPDAAERHLQQQLAIQATTMASKGIDPARMDEELCALEYAIRSAAWGFAMFPGDAA